MSGLKSLDPVTAYGRWARNYPPHAHNPVMCAEERAMCESLPKSLKGLRVLDAGCGSGRYIRLARERGATRVVGTDVSAEMLAQAETAGLGKVCPTFNERTDDAVLLKAPIDRLPLPDAWADVIVSALAIGHTKNLGSAVTELARVTKPGGTILISDFHPTIAQMGFQRTFVDGADQFAVDHHIHLYSDWLDAASAAGLRIVKLREPRVDKGDFGAAENSAIEKNTAFYDVALTVPPVIVVEMRVDSTRGGSHE